MNERKLKKEGSFDEVFVKHEADEDPKDIGLVSGVHELGRTDEIDRYIESSRKAIKAAGKPISTGLIECAGRRLIINRKKEERGILDGFYNRMYLHSDGTLSDIPEGENEAWELEPLSTLADEDEVSTRKELK